MRNVVQLNQMPADSAVLRNLPRLSPGAMRFVLALLSYRHLTGRTGIVAMSEVSRASGISPKKAITDELFDAGVMGQRDDGIVVYHPLVQAMMLPEAPAATDTDGTHSNVVALPTANSNKHRKKRSATG